MTPVQFAKFVRYKASADDVSLPDDELIMLANAYKDEIAGGLQRRRPDIWNIPFTDDLQLNKREYAIPEDILNRIVYVELDLDNNGKFTRARKIQFNHNEYGLTEENINRDYNGFPSYYLRRNAIYLLTKPVLAVTGGLRGVYDVFPADLTDLTVTDDMAIDPTTTSSGVPRSLHEIWARRTSIAYKDANGITLSAEEQAFSDNLENLLDNMAMGNLDESYTGSMPLDPDNSNQGYEN